MKSNQSIVTRFAPSPTGLLHAGNYRTAVFAYLFARQHKGKFILRLEDTDRERSRPEYEANILDSLSWLGLEYDELHHQSKRSEHHRAYLEKMIAGGQAYISKETPVKEGGRSEVIRFKNPNRTVTFTDLIRGEIIFDTTELGDFVIAKSLDEPLFHLAVVADDADLGITHIIRGEDHISNTPRQILIQEAINAPTPLYAHLPLVLAPDRSKLSKRKGALALTEYRKQGYLPEALLNFMTMLGWNPGTDEEVLSKAELMEKFNLSKVQKAGAIFNEEKLRWFNREHLRRRPAGELKQLVLAKIPNLSSLPEISLERLLPVILERVETIADLDRMKEEGEWDYFIETPTILPELLKTPKHLPALVNILEQVPVEKFTAEVIKETVWDFATKEGRSEVLWPMRVALTGRAKSPDPFIVASILGKEKTINRLNQGIVLIGDVN
ncbi:MAG: hypothetical protein A2589_01235 [Candidatus Vogelbacteria bacterium RIFOXYD1_FULL_46_19]|uniref:Glutamate--tRNA ligase n=1 Tax=Candidatus Vogelbacteria bacterium RIFOXYD1_FULL_46_19 TaxID=1802439 RepID=A0A1G2QHA8_9BACT|nr:MAG: hypothetical protein A2589_01235 [Candidatus Vogelbacteria bacterium RIFOXYD1_FULL_46_19]